MTRGARARGGFALLTVLWAITAVSVLALLGVRAAREGVGSARNRIALAEAEFAAAGCAARALAAADDALQSGSDDTWLALDSAVAAHVLMANAMPCTVRLRAAGIALDLASIDSRALRALLAQLDVPAERADSMVAAFLDWRDADDVPRMGGAERSWYEAHGRRTPRNAPLADALELRDVRGFESMTRLNAWLDVEPGRISIDHAPLPVLAALPGMTPEAVYVLERARARGERVSDIAAFATSLPPAAQAVLLDRFHEFAPMVTVVPEAWMLEVHGVSDRAPVVFVLELRVVRSGHRAVPTRRRTWIG
jgi:general secretion pathway protein K